MDHSEMRQPVASDAGSAETDTQALIHDVEQTRAEMSETVGAIEEQLQPGRLKGETKRAIREPTIGRVKQAVLTRGQRATETSSQLVVRLEPLARQAQQQR